MAGDRGSEARVRASDRARRVAEAWSRTPHPRPVRTQRGEVHLARVEVRGDGDLTWLDVWVSNPMGEPHYRIVNPPTLVADHNGNVNVGGQRYREDPMAALAEAISAHGGAMPIRRRGHGR